MLVRNFKRILATCLCMVCVFLCVGCNKREKWTFSLNGEKLYDKQVIAFGLIYAKDFNISNTGQLEDYYEPDTTYEQYYKNQLEEDIIATILLYQQAEAEGYKLTKEQNKEAKDKAQTLLDSYSEEWLADRKVSTKEIEKIYKMKLLGDAYVEQEAQKTTENDSEVDNSRYIKVYQVTFPTVELDENGMVKSNQDGTLKELSESNKQSALSGAEDFLAKVQAGEDMNALLKNYDSSVTGIENYYKYKDLDSSYKEMIDTLSDGETGGVIESKYGYIVVKLLEKDATDHEQKIDTYETQLNGQTWKDNLLKELKNSYVGDDKDYKNNDKWNSIKVADFLK